MKKSNRYGSLIVAIFQSHYKPSLVELPFDRDEFSLHAKRLDIELPKNLGDIVYSNRFRVSFPEEITSTAPLGSEWVIEGRGRGKYAFRLRRTTQILPRPDMVAIKIPDATPEVIEKYALGDEQALLAKLRYNRLLDIFLQISTYPLQSHLRTTVTGVGQIEIDEVYVGVDRNGIHYVVPVQAKGGKDRIGSTQASQDIAWARQKFPNLICRAIAAQFMEHSRIALFELREDDSEIVVVSERHYRLVSAADITEKDLASYRTSL